MVDHSFVDTLKDLQKGEISDARTAVSNANLLLKEFPCFQSAQILKAIYLKQISEIDFQEELPDIAVKVQNRSVLYDRVHFAYKKKETAADLVGDLKDLDLANKEELKLDQELEEILNKSEILQQEEELDLALETKNKAGIIQKLDLEDEKEKPLQEEVSSDSESLKDLVDSIRRTQKSKLPLSTHTDKTKNKQPITNTKFSLNSYQDTNVLKLSPFNQWLQKQKQLTVQVNELPLPDKQEELQLDMQASNEAELLLEVKRSNFKLEDFIVGQIEKKQSKKSHNQAGFRHAISETYAKILVDQHKYLEAIDVYKELSIKYPQKSSTFARQIKNLKNKL